MQVTGLRPESTRRELPSLVLVQTALGANAARRLMLSLGGYGCSWQYNELLIKRINMQTQETRIVNQCTYTPVALQPDVFVPEFLYQSCASP